MCREGRRGVGEWGFLGAGLGMGLGMSVLGGGKGWMLGKAGIWVRGLEDGGYWGDIGG